MVKRAAQRIRRYDAPISRIERATWKAWYEATAEAYHDMTGESLDSEPVRLYVPLVALWRDGATSEEAARDIVETADMVRDGIDRCIPGPAESDRTGAS